MRDSYNNCPGVKLLLVKESDEMEEMTYAYDPKPLLVPKIGNRPPYYTNPKCKWYYPTI